MLFKKRKEAVAQCRLAEREGNQDYDGFEIFEVDLAEVLTADRVAVEA